MSELTSCNYCDLQAIKRRARAEGKTVTIKSEPFHTWSSGKRILVDGKEVAWMAKIPEHCCC